MQALAVQSTGRSIPNQANTPRVYAVAIPRCLIPCIQAFLSVFVGGMCTCVCVFFALNRDFYPSRVFVCSGLRGRDTRERILGMVKIAVVLASAVGVYLLTMALTQPLSGFREKNN